MNQPHWVSPWPESIDWWTPQDEKSPLAAAALWHRLFSLRFLLQVPRRSHKHVRRESSQRSLQAVPGATSRPAYRWPPCGRAAHLSHGPHQCHTDHAALDCEWIIRYFHGSTLTNQPWFSKLLACFKACLMTCVPAADSSPHVLYLRRSHYFLNVQTESAITIFACSPVHLLITTPAISCKKMSSLWIIIAHQIAVV